MPDESDYHQGSHSLRLRLIHLKFHLQALNRSLLGQGSETGHLVRVLWPWLWLCDRQHCESSLKKRGQSKNTVVLLGLGRGAALSGLCAAVGEGGYFSFEFFSA